MWLCSFNGTFRPLIKTFFFNISHNEWFVSAIVIQFHIVNHMYSSSITGRVVYDMFRNLFDNDFYSVSPTRTLNYHFEQSYLCRIPPSLQSNLIVWVHWTQLSQILQNYHIHYIYNSPLPLLSNLLRISAYFITRFL